MSLPAPKNIKQVDESTLGISWNDGHDTGLYTHELLRQLCECSACENKKTEN